MSRSLDLVRDNLKAYAGKSENAYFVKVDLGDEGIWWRGFIGLYKNEKEAQNKKDALQITNARVVKTPFVNIIGVFKENKILLEQVNKLQSLGYCPYQIKDDSGRSILVTGAFYTREGAEQQYLELKNAGIDNSVAER